MLEKFAQLSNKKDGVSSVEAKMSLPTFHGGTDATKWAHFYSRLQAFLELDLYNPRGPLITTPDNAPQSRALRMRLLEALQGEAEQLFEN